MKLTAGFALMLLVSFCFAASNERLIAGEKEFACNREANGGLHIINEVRGGIPESEWFDAYPIPEDFPPAQEKIVRQAVKDAYGFKGDAVDFMRKIYSECIHRER